MVKRNKRVELGPYYHQDHIHTQNEIQHGKDLIRYGDLIRFKQIRGTFKFRYLVHNMALDRTWIDCTDALTGEFRSFYVHLLKGPVRPKRSYRKKML